jgi:O-antigen/teichoic acid export membrane protein
MYFPVLISAAFATGIPEAIGNLLHGPRASQPDTIAAGLHVALGAGLVGSAVFAWISPAFLGVETAHLSAEARWASCCAVATVANIYLSCLLRNLGKVDWVNAMLLVLAAGTAICLTALWLASAITPLRVVLAVSGLHLGVLLANFWAVGFSYLGRIPPRQVYGRCLARGFSYLLAGAPTLLLACADRYLLARTTTIAELGFYAVAFALANPVCLMLEAFSQLGFVEAAEAKRVGNHQLILNRFCAAQVIVAPICCGVALVAPPLIYFGFGKAFSPSLGIIYWMLPGMALHALSRTADGLLRGMNRVWPGAVSGLVALAVLTAGALFWCPTEGACGCGKAFLLCQGIRCLILVACLRVSLEAPLWRLWGLRYSVLKLIWLRLRHLLQWA